MQCHAIFARRLNTTLQSSTLCQAYYATFPVSCTNNMQLLGHNQANIDQFSAWLPFRPLPPPLSPPPLLISGKATAWIPPLPPLPLYLPAMQLPVFPQGTSVPRGYQVGGGGGVRRCGN